jgi:hypothetical protein
MSGLGEKLDTIRQSQADDPKLEDGLTSEITPAPEVTFSWSNPGPLFKSARRVLIFSLITSVVLVTLDRFHVFHPSYPMYYSNVAVRLSASCELSSLIAGL